METKIEVKEYTSGYQSQVVDLILHIQQQEYGIPITKEDQPDLFNIENFYQKENGNFWVAVSDERVVGTIALLDIGNHQGALRKVFVAKEFRGKVHKTAILLLNKVFEWGRKKEVNEIFLGTTLQFVAAHRFYEKHGFEEITAEELPAAFPILKIDKKFYRYVIS
ncbi:GNAT family N-acetyltransferase [Peribacillus saganii]|uniref:GNAT family N-acetyltransferase n=1 Tax=Peribacillus saganii TaxID=2303992 RepID=A0A372LPJ1_9BACI|nr:GNAT family N-acetyltransferase [Peribacillus saganii]RFU69272.1 GNAT family N-acetyltransferase [Peribacillus saganii]